jgi:predicted nicotinamide N-methyase
MKIKTAITDKLTSCGVTLLLPNHKEIMKLRKVSAPTEHGHKVWPTTWLLIDYLKNSCNLKGKRVLDLACGWGLPGIFCAKTGKAKVTWIDTDEKVLPYLKALANENGVVPNFIALDINRVGYSILKDIDIIIASDICFCDTLIDPIRRMINRAKKAKVQEIYISDPGRWPFEDLAELLVKKSYVELLDREITAPVNTHGKILKISF